MGRQTFSSSTAGLGIVGGGSSHSSRDIFAARRCHICFLTHPSCRRRIATLSSSSMLSCAMDSMSYADRFSSSHPDHSKLDLPAIKCSITVAVTHTASKSSLTNSLTLNDCRNESFAPCYSLAACLHGRPIWFYRANIQYHLSINFLYYLSHQCYQSCKDSCITVTDF